MGQVPKWESAWNLVTVLQIVLKNAENCCPCLYLSIDQVWWLYGLWFKRYIQKCTLFQVLIPNTHHGITDSVNLGMVKNTKTWIPWEWNIIFLRNKKILNLCLRWHILRSYRFVANCLSSMHFWLLSIRLIITWDVGNV